MAKLSMGKRSDGPSGHRNEHCSKNQRTWMSHLNSMSQKHQPLLQQDSRKNRMHGGRMKLECLFPARSVHRCASHYAQSSFRYRAQSTNAYVFIQGADYLALPETAVFCLEKKSTQNTHWALLTHSKSSTQSSLSFQLLSSTSHNDAAWLGF